MSAWIVKWTVNDEDKSPYLGFVEGYGWKWFTHQKQAKRFDSRDFAKGASMGWSHNPKGPRVVRLVPKVRR